MKKLAALSAAVLMVAGSASAVWVVDWTESLRLIDDSNIYYSGGVFGGQFYAGYIDYGPVAFNSTQTGGTALAHHFRDTTKLPNAAKAATLLNGKVYYTGGDSNFVSRVDNDWASNATSISLSDPDVIPESITTDGTFLYTNDDKVRGNILKWQVVGNSLNLVTTYHTAAGRFRAVTYYDGKLYAVDYYGTDVYEIDVASGTVSTIGQTHTGGYQVARFGNKVLITNNSAVGAELESFDYVGGSLVNRETFDLGLGDLYGIAFDDANHAWVASARKGPLAQVSYISVPEQSELSFQMAGTKVVATGFQLQWNSMFGLTYRVEVSTNLTDTPAFFELQSGIPGASDTNVTEFIDTNMNEKMQAFYRVYKE